MLGLLVRVFVFLSITLCRTLVRCFLREDGDSQEMLPEEARSPLKDDGSVTSGSEWGCERESQAKGMCQPIPQWLDLI